MFGLNNEVVIRYDGQSLELSDKNQLMIVTTYNQALSGNWKSVFFTFEHTQEQVVVHFGGETNISAVTISDVSFSNVIHTIIIGENFNGFLQDIRVYIPSLQPVNSQITLPVEASFLPQCLCPNGFSLSPDEANCIMTDQTSLTR